MARHCPSLYIYNWQRRRPYLTPYHKLTRIATPRNTAPMSRSTRYSERRRVVNRRPNLSTQDQPDFGVDTLTEGIARLEFTDPLLSFDTTDRSLRLTPTSRFGDVTLYSLQRPDEILEQWELTGWNGKAGNKTLSLLIMGHNLAPKAAKSGWADSLNQDKASNVYSPINGTTYTETAWQLCRLLKCGLVPKTIDAKGKPGYFEASHAEMHLIAWFVETYFPRLLKGGSAASRVELPQFLENILIISNREPYPSCLELAARVKELTGVTITIEYRGRCM